MVVVDKWVFLLEAQVSQDGGRGLWRWEMVKKNQIGEMLFIGARKREMLPWGELQQRNTSRLMVDIGPLKV